MSGIFFKIFDVLLAKGMPIVEELSRCSYYTLIWYVRKIIRLAVTVFAKNKTHTITYLLNTNITLFII